MFAWLLLACTPRCEPTAPDDVVVADWHVAAPPTDADLRDVAVADGTGWAVGDGGAVWLTWDGGETWAAEDVATAADLRAVALGGPRAVAVGARGVVARLDGSAWQIGAYGEADLNDVAFHDPTGLVVGAGTIATTSDGGATFTPAPLALDAALYGAAWADADTALAVGEALVAYDAGAWTTAATTATLRDVAFADADTALAVGDAGAVWRWDAGAWAPLAPTISDDLVAIAFADGVAWVATARGAVWRSTDLGDSFADLAAADAPLSGLATFTDATTPGTQLVAVGDAGTVLVYGTRDVADTAGGDGCED